MKRYLVMSDTHIPTRQEELPDIIFKELENCEGVIALGDFVDIDTVMILKKTAKNFYGVHGNMDFPDVKDYLPFSTLLQIEGVTLGLCHGWGAPWGIRKRILSHFKEKPDIILFGHTHEFEDSVENGVRFLNPGTATKGGTFGILIVDGRNVKFDLKKI